MQNDIQLQSGNVEFMYNNFIEAGTVGDEKDPFIAAARQMVENSDDAGATRIEFQIKVGEWFRCLDNGVGVTKDKEPGLNRLGFRNKEFGKTGKNGTGRAFNMKIARETHNRFTSSDYHRIMIHRFTREHVKAILSSPLLPLKNPIIEDSAPPPWCLEHFGNAKTGMAVELIGINWDLFTSMKKFRTKLSEALSVWTAKKVYVNDGVNNEMIPQRDLDGEYPGKILISGDFWKCIERVVGEMKNRGEIAKDVPIDALKTCEFFFGRAKNPTKADRIFFGKNPIISIDDFLAHVRDDLLVAQLDAYPWIRGKTVTGFIDLPIVNQFAHHGRGTLNPSIFDDKELIEHVVFFLADEIAPRLVEQYSLQEDQKEAAEKQDDLKVLAGLFGSGNPLGGTTCLPGVLDGEKPIPPGPRNRPDVVVSPSKLEIVIGQEQAFEVVRGHKNGKWNAKKSGGTIDVEAGPRVWYTSGDKVGRYSLEYVPPKGEKVAISIEVLEKSRFQFSKRFFDIYPGGDFEVFVLNYDGSEKIQFELFHQNSKRPTSHITLENLGKGARFKATHDCPPDFYQFVAKTQSGEKTKGVVHVHPYPHEFAPIGDMWYLLKKNTPKSPLVDISRWHGASPDNKESTRVMLVNPDADPMPEIEKRYGRGDTFYHHLRTSMINAAIVDQKVENPMSAFCQWTLEVMKQALKKKKKK